MRRGDVAPVTLVSLLAKLIVALNEGKAEEFVGDGDKMVRWTDPSTNAQTTLLIITERDNG